MAIPSQREDEKKLTGRHVLFMLVAFFLLVSAVNGAFVYIAVTGFSGNETEDAYVKGLRYNETLAAAEAQKALKWRVELDATSDETGPLHIAARFRDRWGQALNGLSITVELRRPARQDLDLGISLSPLGEGRYEADLDLPLKGQWDLYLKAEDDQGRLYRLEQRIWQK